MKKDDAEEYTQSLGQIVAGSWRQIALAKRLGVPKALGQSVEDWVNHRLGGYVKQSIAERREAAKELADEGESQREIADVLGVSQPTVLRDLADTNVSFDEKQPEGKQEVTKEADTNVSPEPLDTVTNLAADEAIRAKAGENTHVSNNSGEHEWYTPIKFIKAAKAVMGDIDLDPASSEKANETVGAAEIYTKDNDGLGQEWFGRIWLNPPYAQPLIMQFVEKLISSLPVIEEAVVLVNNATDTKWFQLLARNCGAICFTDKRVKFLDPDGNPGAPLQGQAVLYFGGNREIFISEFFEFGFVLSDV